MILTAADVHILATLVRQGPTYGYQLAPSHRQGFSRATLYRSCQKLAYVGLCTVQVKLQPAAPARKVLSITPKGRRVLAQASGLAQQKHADRLSSLLAKYLRERERYTYHLTLNVALNGNQNHIPSQPKAQLP